jgi:hypothetical protein
MWPWSWYFSQVITCLLLFAAIAETIGRRRDNESILLAFPYVVANPWG